MILRSGTRVPCYLDVPLLVAELLMRNVNWRSKTLRRRSQSRNRRRASVIQACAREELLEHLTSIGVTGDALVLMHTRVTGLHIHSSPATDGNTWRTSELVLSDLLNLLEPAGTLTMPTNAKYQLDLQELDGHSDDIITYNPLRTPCAVGLVNELFWRRKGTKRSLFPYNMLAARGPLADELLRDNLNERKPSPHGIDSGYYRICQHNGLVVSIGLPLCDCLTLAHVVEEVREDWPIKDFFTERRYRVVQNGMTREWTIREPRDAYGKFCHCHKKMARDLVAEGLIHEGGVGTVRVDWARAAELYEFFWRKTAKRPYPYYALWLGRKR